MQAQQRLEFGSPETEQVYEYIERTGAVDRDELAQRMELSADDLDRCLDDLTADGYIEERRGTFQLTFEHTDEVTYETDGTEVTIRPTTQGDLKGLIGVMRAVAEEDAYLTAETYVDLIDEEEVIFRKNNREVRMCFVATVDDDVVGWAHLHSPNFAKLRHTAELTMGVLADHRGKGIGSRLLEHGLKWAEENGYEKVYQSLPATNQKAVRFLEEHNWETEAIRRAHFKIDDEYVAEQQMAIMLHDPVLG